MKKYLIRLDDACPTMDISKWQRIENILDAYGIRPMVGVIPANEDPKQKISTVNLEFWTKVRAWEKKGWAIAMHGYNHCYISNDGLKGMNPLWNRSEFAGVPIEKQKQKISDGVSILKSHGLNPKYFFAPSHTFDENTLQALKECSDIRIISDTVATMPYKSGGFIFIPQIGGHCVDMPLSGVFTFCFHPNTMNDTAFDSLKVFIENHESEFCGFDELDLKCVKSKSLKDKFISWLYFSKRTLKINCNG